MRGRIIKGIAGSYYVRGWEKGEGNAAGAFPSGHVYECKAKGVFRKEKLRPLVGDEVEIDVLDQEKKLGNIRKLLPRHSELIRPAVANVDQALVIFSIAQPKPGFNLLDRFLIMMRQQGIESIICLNKADLDQEGEGERYCRIYAACGYRTLEVSARQAQGIDSLRAMLEGKVTVVAGPSGVGKSSIINCLQSDIVMETGEISTKIQRGKHTTRHSELIALGDVAYILDTPGFSSLGLFDLDKRALAGYYPEFAEHVKSCRYGDCTHVSEPDCGVKAALEAGDISRMRYGNYCLLFDELSRTESRSPGSRQRPTI